MRTTLALVVVLFSGCKTAEVVLTHPATGLHLAARVEAKEGGPPYEKLLIVEGQDHGTPATEASPSN